MQAVETAGALVAIAALIGVWRWAVRQITEAAAEGEADLEELLLGPYLTVSDHHDFIADRWSVIADAAVVVGMEQSLRNVKSPRERGVRGRR